MTDNMTMYFRTYSNNIVFQFTGLGFLFCGRFDNHIHICNIRRFKMNMTDPSSTLFCQLNSTSALLGRHVGSKQNLIR